MHAARCIIDTRVDVTGAVASGLIFRHTKNTKLCLGQSVDGIYFARRSGAHNARIDGHGATQLVPHTPSSMLARAIFIPFGRVPIAEIGSTLRRGLGGCVLQILIDKSNGADPKSGQYLFHPQYWWGWLMVDEKQDMWRVVATCVAFVQRYKPWGTVRTTRNC